MKLFSSGYLDDAYMEWLGSSMSCCGASLREQAPIRGVEKPMRIEHHQPRLIPPPIPESQERPSTGGQEWVNRSRSISSRASFSVRRKLNAYNGPRRTRGNLVISGPTDFRHVENSMPRRREVFRPLELSIYMPENQLSPILPHFSTNEDLSFPPDDSKELPELPYPPTAITHSRSESALSFRIPRKPVRSSSRASSEWTAQFKPRPDSLSAQELLAALESELPKAPPPARLRAMTEPPSYERVKSALHERHELERRLKDIDEQIEERRSVYMSSRPTSRAASARPTSVSSVYEESQEPMPKAPAMKPSFAARVSPILEQRPKTAPSKTVHIPTRLKSFHEASAAFNTPPALQTGSPSPSQVPTPSRSPAPPPPLPLVLQAPRPPLRKKKSFSRVSNWLFPEHSRNISLDSVTNTPKPVTSREGFYQCVELEQAAPARMSVDSVESASTDVSTLESEIDQPTPPTTWTPQSSPGGAGKRDVTIRTMSIEEERQEKSIELTRMRTFGEEDGGKVEEGRMQPMPGHVHGRNSVGVAF